MLERDFGNIHVIARPLPRPDRKRHGRDADPLAEMLFGLIREAYASRLDGRPAEAVTRYRRVLALRPGLADIHNDLGNALAELGNNEEAIAEFQQAIAINRNLVEAWCNWGFTLIELRRIDEADTKFRNALAVDRRHAAAHYGLSLLMKARGRFDDAVQEAERAIKCAPDQAIYYDHLAALRPFTIGDRYFSAVERLGSGAAAANPIATKDRSHRHLALFRCYDHAGNVAAAFEHLATANRLKRQQIGYDEKKMLGLMERTRSVLTADLIASRRGAGDPSSVPIFVIGMPRSGTSLIEQILASHPDVFGAGELDIFDRLTGEVSNALPGKPPFPVFVPRMTPDYIRALGTSYLLELAKRAPKAKRIVDKMPTNFHFLGLIHMVLPNARIIHAVRDPIDTCVSCFTASFKRQPQTYDLAELGRYFRHYQELMAHWRRVLPAGQMLEVRYEELVGDLESVARRLIAHCGLAWDPRCLEFHRIERPVFTASDTQVRRPIYKSSIGRWRKYEEFLAPLLDALQYSYVPTRAGAT